MPARRQLRFALPCVLPNNFFRSLRPSEIRGQLQENWLLAHQAAWLHADILKVGHHGSSTSSSDAFLDAVVPRLALVSVGSGNSYHLPTPGVMRALAAHGAQVLRTDRLGTIVVRTDGRRILIDAGGDTWELPPTTPRGP